MMLRVQSDDVPRMRRGNDTKRPRIEPGSIVGRWYPHAAGLYFTWCANTSDSDQVMMATNGGLVAFRAHGDLEA